MAIIIATLYIFANNNRHFEIVIGKISQPL